MGRRLRWGLDEGEASRGTHRAFRDRASGFGKPGPRECWHPPDQRARGGWEAPGCAGPSAGEEAGSRRRDELGPKSCSQGPGWQDGRMPAPLHQSHRNNTSVGGSAAGAVPCQASFPLTLPLLQGSTSPLPGSTPKPAAQKTPQGATATPGLKPRPGPRAQTLSLCVLLPGPTASRAPSQMPHLHEGPGS